MSKIKRVMVKLVAISIIAACFILLIIFITVDIHLFPSDSDFCTTSDTEFVEFSSKLPGWIEEFSDYDPGFIGGRVIRLDLVSDESNQKFVAWADYSQNLAYDPVFYIAIGMNWPSTRIGDYGYIYIPTGQLPYQQWTESDYEFRRISGKIFCYRDFD